MYVCANKNRLARRTIIKAFLTSCNDPRDYSQHKFLAMGVLQIFSQSFQTSTVDLQKAFFCTHQVIILKFWERIAKNEDLLRFSQYKKN